MATLFAILETKIATPQNFGWFHFLFLFLITLATVLSCVFFRNCSDKAFRRFALICWLIMLIFEIYKQFIYTFDFVDGKIIGDYKWNAFPFQLCSTPLYVLPLVAFLKDGKIRRSATAFISAFAFFGGLAVCFYPNDVFTEFLGIDIQTMTHHGLQVVTGIFFAVYNRKKIGFKYFLSSIPTFLVLLVIAVGLNEIVNAYFIANNISDTFNMFFISRFIPNHLPILSAVYLAVDWIFFLLIYAVGFTFVSLLIFYVIVGINLLVNKHSHKNGTL